ncbi:MAG: hypothetical protein FKY71_19445 [Spiribacter salinus]|uniref:Uncharacterized protein n=1 Tax=Spiribacter salinus TaxID=1335746 RepID=A0A540V7D7_9GAMM|nr:MAG: hypothetical protein FKY71_19445 [Spiribacter salinus]
MAALLAMLPAMLWAMPVQAETRNYVLEMYDNFGQLVAIHQLRLDFGPEDGRSTRTISGVRTADQVDPAYQPLLGGSEKGGGAARGPRLRLTLSRSVVSPLLEIEAVLVPDRNGAFEGRWKRFGCFSGASGTLTAWPIGSTARQ